jgi:hypothetical protein
MKDFAWEARRTVRTLAVTVTIPRQILSSQLPERVLVVLLRLLVVLLALTELVWVVFLLRELVVVLELVGLREVVLDGRRFVVDEGGIEVRVMVLLMVIVLSLLSGESLENGLSFVELSCIVTHEREREDDEPSCRKGQEL